MQKYNVSHINTYSPFTSSNWETRQVEKIVVMKDMDNTGSRSGITGAVTLALNGEMGEWDLQLGLLTDSNHNPTRGDIIRNRVRLRKY